VISAEDLRLDAKTIQGTFGSVDDVIGQEAKVSLYAGRPVRHGEIGPPALIERNQVVPLVFNQSGLRISTEGRALARGAAGEIIRVMNLSSKATLFGQIQSDGSIQVTN
jgi:flagella basal body P-ring formation protein FlgA